jgi:coxsackievirus/adenovirus receptor
VRNGSAGCVCPEKKCLSVTDPLCGSDGVTYGNTCELEKASCEQQKHITIENRGNCVKMGKMVYSFCNYSRYGFM